MPRQTVLDQIEIRGDGTINVRFDKQVVDAGDILAREWHRTSFAPGDDIDAQMAVVNAHLAQLGYPSVVDLSAIKAHAKVAWTKQIVAAFRERAAAAAAPVGGSKT